MSLDLENQNIQDTFQRLVQVSGSNLVDGTGSVLLALKADNLEGSLSGSFEGTFTQGKIGDGIDILSGSTIFKSDGYRGSISASLGLTPGGFVLYSGSNTTTLGGDTLAGTGFQFVSANDNSHIIFTDQNDGDLSIKTDKFIVQNNGNITASNALFSGTAIARNLVESRAVVSGPNVNDNYPTASWNSYISGDYTQPVGAILYLDGSQNGSALYGTGSIANNVEFVIVGTDAPIYLAEILLKDGDTLANEKVGVSVRNNTDSEASILFNLKTPDGIGFSASMAPGNIYDLEFAFGNAPGNQRDNVTITLLNATDFSLPITASNSGINIKGNLDINGTINATSFTGSLLGTSSNAVSASYAESASFITTAQTASYVLASNIDQPFTNITGSNISASGDLIVGGNIGILTNNPATNLHIQTPLSPTIRLESTENKTPQIQFYNNQSPDFVIQNKNNDAGFQIASVNGPDKAFITIGANDGDVIELSGSLSVTGVNGHITASGNISASGNIIANDAILDNLSINTPISSKRLDVKGPTNFLIQGATHTFDVEGAGSSILMRVSSSGNVGIGTDTPSQLLEVSGSSKFTDDLQLIGKLELTLEDPSSVFNNRSIIIGYDQSTGSNAERNVAIGYAALSQSNAGDDNVAVGYFALASNGYSDRNTAIGAYTLSNYSQSSVEFVNNTAVGHEAGNNLNSGVNNTLIGAFSLSRVTNGSNNIAIGRSTGGTIVGGADFTTGDGNIFIGNDIHPLNNSNNNSIIIGNDSEGLGSNSVVLGNDSIDKTVLKGKIGIGINSPETALHISSSATVSAVLTLDPQHPLPTNSPTGSFAVSSSSPPKPYFYNGTTWNALY
jgi:hypothetical protein